MTFGRTKNLTRRPHRPDGQFHRLKRRGTLTTRLTASNDSFFRSLIHMLKTALRRK